MPSNSAVFVDTSAVLALLVSTDSAHPAARTAFDTLAREDARLVTSSYVLLEIYALVARRLGLPALRRVREEFAPLLEVVWVDRELHEHGLDLLLGKARRRLSLVDAVSFGIMHARRIERAFAYDDHFAQHGFVTV